MPFNTTATMPTSHGRSDTSFAKLEISGNDYASDELPEPPP
jgi:hypothetical protein